MDAIIEKEPYRDIGSNATSSHPTEMNSLTFQLFWGLPNADCGIVNPIKSNSIGPNPTTHRIA